MTDIFAYGSGGGGGPDNDRDSLFSGDAFEMILGIAEGEVEGIKGETIAEQLNHVYIDGTAVLGPNGEKNFKESQVILSYERGSLATVDEDPLGQTPIPYVLSGTASPITVGATLNYNVPVTRVIPSSYRNKYHRLEIRLLVQRLVSLQEKGAKSLDVRVHIRYKPLSSVTWTSSVEKISGKTVSGGFVKSFMYAIHDTSEDYVVEVTQLDDSDPEGDVRDLVWTTIEVSEPLGADGQPIREFHAGTAMMAFVAKVGENFQRLPNISAVWRGLLCSVPSNYNPVTRTYNESTPWNGAFKATKAWTNNPFWIARELILNPRFGMARYNPTVSVDDYSLYEEAKYADTLRTITLPNGDTKQIPLFTFNAVLSDPMNGLELINFILSSANAQAVEYSSGYIRIISDRNTPSVMTVIPEMCIQQSEDVVFTYSDSDIKERFNELTVTYIEPEMDWQTQYIGPFVDEEAQAVQGVNPSSFEALGCTNVHEAQYKAYFRLIAAQTETLSVTFAMPSYPMEWDIGDIIDIVDPTMDWGLSGRARLINGTTVSLRTPLYFEESGTYTIEVQTRNNSRVSRQFTLASAGTHSALTLNAAIANELSDYPAFWITKPNAVPGMAKPFRVVAIQPVEGKPYQYSVSAIEVNRAKWEQALAYTVGKIPQYSFKQVKKVPAPTNLRWTKETALATTKGSQEILSLTWDIPDLALLGLSFTLQHSINGAPFTDVEITRLNFIDVAVELGVNYVFRIKQSYLGEETFSNTLEYTLEPVKASELVTNRLSVGLNGRFVENNFELVVTPTYQFDTSLPPVDLLKSGRIQAIKVVFYGKSGGSDIIIATKYITTNEVTLSEAEQYQSRTQLYSHLKVVVQLQETTGTLFPVDGVSQEFVNGNAAFIKSINATATALTISATAELENELRRGQTVRWFIGKIPTGTDRQEIAEGVQLYAYPINQPNTQFYLWCRVTGAFGESSFYPAGNGHPIKTGLLDEDAFGLQATTHWLTRSAAAIKKVNQSYDITSVTIEAFSQTGNGPVQAYAGLFKVRVKNTNGLWSDLYSSAIPQSSYTFEVPTGITTISYQLYSANDSSQKLDEENTVIVEDGVTYDLKIISTNGTIFRVNQATTTTFIAKVFKNGVDITDQIPESKFRWRRVSLNPQPAPKDDASWNALYQTGYKQILVTVDDVAAKATFFCDLIDYN